KLPMEMTLTENSSIRFLGRVTHCLLIKKDTEHYNIGIEFIDMIEKDKETLAEFIHLVESVKGMKVDTNL
ncbi:MAG TPA: PilZ domain-containing protein, partial [Thermodesulfovibrionales bacterium]|nr:PilZ domain-containing protein [Thermodesulfovibrionales bacterium]